MAQAWVYLVMRDYVSFVTVIARGEGEKQASASHNYLQDEHALPLFFYLRPSLLFGVPKKPSLSFSPTLPPFCVCLSHTQTHMHAYDKQEMIHR